MVMKNNQKSSKKNRIVQHTMEKIFLPKWTEENKRIKWDTKEIINNPKNYWCLSLRYENIILRLHKLSQYIKLEQ